MTVDGTGGWTTEQQRIVAEMRPRLVALAARLARRFPVLDETEILAVAEDRVLSDVRRYDASRGMSLYSFSFRAIMRDVLRAAYARLEHPARQAWNAARRCAAEFEPATLDERVTESAGDKVERARSMGIETALAAAFAYECHVAREPMGTPEDALMAKETRRRLADAVARMGAEPIQLMRLLYVEERSYDEAARTLQATVPQIKYSERKILASLRKSVTV
jgi:RNA polymerase sigma factor (sigma-70 family)